MIWEEQTSLPGKLGDNLTLGRTFLIGHHGLTTIFSQGQNLSMVSVTISNNFKSPYRGICVWTFCYWYFCKCWTSSHWAPNSILLDGVQAELHQYRLPSSPPVYKQWEHLHRGPGSDRKGSEILSFQTRCSEHLFRLIRHGEYASLVILPKSSSGWDVCLSALLSPILSSLSQWFLKSHYNMFLLYTIMPLPPPPTS